MYLLFSIVQVHPSENNISFDKQEHYDWNLSECMGTTASTSTSKYYPDWLGDKTCKNDGSAPEYMVLNPTMWLHDTLSDCCKVCL